MMAFVKSDIIVAQSGISDGQIVADFGSGAGGVTIAIARKVGHTGKVYAIDVQKEVLSRVLREARDENLSNVEIVWGDFEEEGGTKLPNAHLDTVIMSNVLFQLDDQKGAFAEARRVLKTGGKLLVSDWLGSFNNFGPPDDQIVTEDMAKALATQNGFVFTSAVSAGDYHYGLIFEKIS